MRHRYPIAMAYAGSSYAHPLQEQKMSISAIICPKLPSCPPLRKLWSVIVGCHGCNKNVNLAKFCAVDGRFPKKGHSPIIREHADHRQYRSSKTLEVNTLSSRTILSTAFIVRRSPQINVSHPPPFRNFYVRPSL